MDYECDEGEAVVKMRLNGVVRILKLRIHTVETSLLERRNPYGPTFLLKGFLTREQGLQRLLAF